MLGAVARLGKRDVEQLLATYDADPVEALRGALATVLDRPGADWSTVLAASGLPPAAVASLRAADPSALDDLARTLNELRTLPGPA